METKNTNNNKLYGINHFRRKADSCIGCPINKKIPTEMFRNEFEKMCLLRSEKIPDNWGNKSTFCGKCGINKKIKNGEKYDPPYNMTIKDK